MKWLKHWKTNDCEMTKAVETAVETVELPNTTNDVDDEWIWVDGYKGTTKELYGHNSFQFAVGQKYKAEGEVILCENGFHFCRNLSDVFAYYPPITFDSYLYQTYQLNRYFRIQALVKKSDWEITDSEKYVAKEIRIFSEIDRTDEVFVNSLVGWKFHHYNGTFEIKDHNFAQLFVQDIKLFFKNYHKEQAKLQEIKLHKSQSDLHDILGGYGFGELFITLIITKDLRKNETMIKIAQALISENISKEMLIYYLLNPKEINFCDSLDG